MIAPFSIGTFGNLTYYVGTALDEHDQERACLFVDAVLPDKTSVRLPIPLEVLTDICLQHQQGFSEDLARRIVERDYVLRPKRSGLAAALFGI